MGHESSLTAQRPTNEIGPVFADNPLVAATWMGPAWSRRSFLRGSATSLALAFGGCAGAARHASTCSELPPVDLASTFPGGRVAAIEIPTERHPLGHHHSTLAADCDRDAFADTVAYLRARLGLAQDAQRMRLPVFEAKPCRVTARGRWETI
jgi:hypothetical protein